VRAPCQAAANDARAVVAVDAGAVVGFDQLEAVFIEILQRLIVAIDVIENTELQGPFASFPLTIVRL